MAFKLSEAAQERSRALDAPHLVALVRAGARFECGKLVERGPVLEVTQAADDTPAVAKTHSRPPNHRGARNARNSGRAARNLTDPRSRTADRTARGVYGMHELPKRRCGDI